MTIARVARFLFACLLVLSLSAGPANAQRKKQIAVLDFDFATVDLGLADRAYGGKQNLARRVADKLVTSLVGLGTCQVVERSQLEKVLSEQNLGAQGRLDASTAAKIGRVLGVDALIIGNVSIFELQGMPQPNDTFWDNKKMRARIAVNFRVIDTTTAVVELSNEQSGMSKEPPKNAGKMASKIGGFFKKGDATVKDEEIRDVVQQALDETVGKITVDVEKYLSGALRPAEPTMTADKQVMGAVIEVNGPSLVITGIAKGAVRIGDRLYVRRGKVRRDPINNRDIRYSEKVGEVEVVEIQDEAIMGSFSGSGAAQTGDAVTNNPTASVPLNQAPGSPATPNPAGRSTTRPTTQPAPQPQKMAAPAAENAGSKQEQGATVSAAIAWNDTGIDLPQGVRVEVLADGAIKFSATRTVGPNGFVSPSRPTNLPLPGAPIGALVARVRYADGQVSPIQLVGMRNHITAAKSGRLLLGVNDTDVKDNSGSFAVTVRW
jgi:curli biogenesis system outer membrane secretion channel CsgG